MTSNNPSVETGSGNVYADLGTPEAETQLLKAQLVNRIDAVIRQMHLTQAQAAERLGLSQPDVSRLLRGQFRDYSVERLLRLLTTLGHDVEIVVHEPQGERPGKLHIEAA